MINSELLSPRSIAIIGASNTMGKPGGSLVKNLKTGGFKGAIYPVNPKESLIQDLKVYNELKDLPNTDMVILAVPASVCVDAVEYLASYKGTKAFIIISAGFSEVGEEGKVYESRLTELVDTHKLAIIGPNCIGVINPIYKAVFISPVPEIVKSGVDFVSASGAFAVFLFELSALHGLKFSTVYTVGNSLDIGVEDVLKHWDESFIPGESSRIKLVYVEQIKKPHLFFKHIQSLRKKSCHVLVLKPGDSEAGARAALSHTGSLAGDSKAFGWLIKKAGAIRCHSREEMVHVAAILGQNSLGGNKIAVVTHAGGPAVMLTDQLQKSGLEVPQLLDTDKKSVLNNLYSGASALNPIDLLATANHEQLKFVVEYCNNLDYIDGVVVIYGKTGMEDLNVTYKVLSDTVSRCQKPVYCITPSINSAAAETSKFISLGNVVYFDEVVFASALNEVIKEPQIFGDQMYTPSFKYTLNSDEVYPLVEEEVFKRLTDSGIPTVDTNIISSPENLDALKALEYPVVAKVLGILHKTEVQGVILNIQSYAELKEVYQRLMAIKNAKGILIQKMLSGTEIYLGGKMHPGIGYSIHVGVGGVFIELVKDISSALAPVNVSEARYLIEQLKAQKLFSGYRNMPAINRDSLAQIIVSFSELFNRYPDIAEIDLNPLIAVGNQIVAVDARIISKEK